MKHIITALSAFAFLLAGPALAGSIDAAPTVAPGYAAHAAPVTVARAPSRHKKAAPAPAAGQEAMVWMNTRTHVYHNAGCRYYQNTAEGQLEPLSQAQQTGRPCHKCGG